MKIEPKQTTFPSLDDIYKAAERLKKIAAHTPLQHNLNLSERYEANILLKREIYKLFVHTKFAVRITRCRSFRQIRLSCVRPPEITLKA
jgi:hypothetical protein